MATECCRGLCCVGAAASAAAAPAAHLNCVYVSVGDAVDAADDVDRAGVVALVHGNTQNAEPLIFQTVSLLAPASPVSLVCHICRARPRSDTSAYSVVAHHEHRRTPGVLQDVQLRWHFHQLCSHTRHKSIEVLLKQSGVGCALSSWSVVRLGPWDFSIAAAQCHDQLHAHGHPLVFQPRRELPLPAGR